MVSKRENIAKELGNPRTRLVMIVSAVILVVVLVAAWAIMAKRNRATSEELSSEVTAPPQMGATSGMQAGQPGVATAEYDALVAAGDRAEVEAAKAEGGSAIPTPRAGTAASAFEGEPGPIAQASAAATPPVTTTTTTQTDATQAEQQRQQAWEQQVQARMAAMRGQMQKIDKYWAIQSHERFQVQAGARAGAQGEAAASQMSQASTPDDGDGDVTVQSPTTVQAAGALPDIAMGDVLYGTLDFGINTDDPASASYIQATIRQPGPFQGAKVLGALQEGDQHAKTVGIHFTQMKVPGEVGMRTIDAWAVGPNTQRASMASKVNNHYVSRGFSVLVGSFLEGYSQALLAGGRQQNIVSTPNGSVVMQQDAFSSKQLAQIGVGNVGKGMSQMFAQAATRQKTVTVNAGADLGVWFLKDVEPGQ